MKRKNKNVLIFIIVISITIAYQFISSLLICKFVGPDYAIQKKLDSLKKNGLIMDYENFYWEYDSKNIASFSVKFANGKTGEIDYAKLNNEKIEFERMSTYNGYGIRGYTVFKNLDGASDICGYRKLLNINTLEDIIENLKKVDAVINEMPVIDAGYPPVYSENFLPLLSDKVHYEDDNEKIIFFRVKKSVP